MRKSGTLGWALFILGTFGVLFSMFVYSVYTTNEETLRFNEEWGADTPDQHRFVEQQLTIVVGGFLVGAFFVLAGVYIVSSVFFHNRELDRLELLEAISGTRLHCDNCGGSLRTDSNFCPGCGRRI